MNFSFLESILSLDKESKIIWIYIRKNKEKEEKRLYTFELESCLAKDWYNAEAIKESLNSNRDELYKTMAIAPN